MTAGERAKRREAAAARAVPWHGTRPEAARKILDHWMRSAAPALVLVLCSCQSGYVLEQGWRQLALSCRQVALDAPELRERLDTPRRARLEWIPRILAFAGEELDLDPGDSYTSYLDTGGEPVSHIVTASHPWALIPYRWCFPVTGCVTYKGYFDPADARREAERLQAEGWDVAVLPVEAYSTLGWFRDPVTSAMLDQELPGLVETLLHELTHRTLYLPGSVSLNEGLATHMAREGTQLFFARWPGAAAPEVLARHRERSALRDQDSALLARLRCDLEAFYRSRGAPERLARRKAEILRTASRARELLGSASAGDALDNARVLAAAVYHQVLPALAALEEKAGGHPRLLMRYLKDLLRRGEKLPPSLAGDPCR